MENKRRTKEEIDKSKSYRERLSEKFNDKFIKRRLINQGTKNEKVIEYIGGDKVVERLNDVFELDWDFGIEDKIVDVEIGHIAILGRLSVSVDGKIVTKEQWGSSVIETYPNGQIISLGDNIKAATTDSLKKCASLLGVGLYLYDSESMKFPSPTQMPPLTAEKEKAIENAEEVVNKLASKAQVSTILKIIKDNELDMSVILQKYNTEKVSGLHYSDAAEFIIKWKSLFSSNSSSE